jgi:hypothetical protein
MTGLPGSVAVADSVAADAWAVRDADLSGVHCRALYLEWDRDYRLLASADVKEPEAVQALSHLRPGELQLAGNRREPDGPAAVLPAEDASPQAVLECSDG